ncbi:hypothetical protein PP339_gp073 [Mycobacterium phage Onyinye]|uniref:Uncharacterized protein n=1 Tax=Mycobacterium phage Onyinye TaxID=2686235 RepID=A0A6B9L6X4_9CAUD|nr:hypothetical protein PP339_gp073 [Mycobacterium phage Onyinye]QHB37477.1 hypothetical protein SEA_ONYINYE_73 [Mycobacterium phage Onyinye]
MSAIHSVTYQCDHCGFKVEVSSGMDDAGWIHDYDYGSTGVVSGSTDLCPNCVNELRAWLRAGPQHAEERERVNRNKALKERRRTERFALTRHPAGNHKRLAFGPPTTVFGDDDDVDDIVFEDPHGDTNGGLT